MPFLATVKNTFKFLKGHEIPEKLIKINIILISLESSFIVQQTINKSVMIDKSSVIVYTALSLLL